MLLAAVLMLCAAISQAQTSDANRFLWDQANARMGTAESPEQFAEAVAVYRTLIDRGVRNAPLLRNYGTALLLAEAPEAAVDALLRAERCGGSTADLRRNLEVALAAMSPLEGTSPAAMQVEVLSWTRIPLFWHYQVPLRMRLQIVLFLQGLLWLAVILRILRRRDTARGLAVAALTGLVLFGSSVLVSLHQESAPFPEPQYRWAVQEVQEP